MSDDWTRQHDPSDDWADAARSGEPAPEGWYDDEGSWDRADELQDWRPPTSGRRKLAIVALALASLLVVVAVAAVVLVQRRIDPPGPPGEDVALVVPTGATTQDIGVLLADADVITSATIWNYWTRLQGVGPFQAGEYTFQANSSFDEAVAVLEAGPRPPELDRVTIPEGLTLTEIATRLGDPATGLERWSTEAFTAAIQSGQVRSQYQPADQPSLEGLLYPDTYEIADGEDEVAFLRRLVAETDRRLTSIDIEGRAAALGYTPYEILVMASLIEEEALVPDERVKISRVIHNRLEQGIPLGIDATNRYEAEIAGRSRDDLDFSSDSPYNTRRVAGLPPTPIAAAGMESIEAALSPLDGPWIFYVLADAQGNHFFTESAREFERAKQECIRLDLGCG